MVEGVRDVRTAQAFLQLYEKHRHVVVLPLGGDAMANANRADELSEVIRLAGPQGKVAALVDSERESVTGDPMKARRGFAGTYDALKIACCVTQRRAIKNYITQRCLDEAFGPER